MLDMVGCMPEVTQKPENNEWSRYPTLKAPENLVLLCDRLMTEVNRRITENNTGEEYTAFANYMMIKRVTIKPMRLDASRPCINLFV